MSVCRDESTKFTMGYTRNDQSRKNSTKKKKKNTSKTEANAPYSQA